METAFQTRLDEEPKHATFFKGVKDFRFFEGKSSKMRGLCAGKLLSILLNASLPEAICRSPAATGSKSSTSSIFASSGTLARLPACACPSIYTRP